MTRPLVTSASTYADVAEERGEEKKTVAVPIETRCNVADRHSGVPQVMPSQSASPVSAVSPVTTEARHEPKPPCGRHGVLGHAERESTPNAVVAV
jgi:hypothetical protein